MTDLDNLRELAAADDYLAVLAVTRPDGRIHASVVKAGVLDDPRTGEPGVGAVVARSALKLAALRRTGRAAVTFKSGYRWAAVEGPVRLEGPDDPPPPGSGPSVASILRLVYRAAGGTHDDWDEFDRTMADDRRCALFLAARRITGNS